jgi:hypothetical protein
MEGSATAESSAAAEDATTAEASPAGTSAGRAVGSEEAPRCAVEEASASARAGAAHAEAGGEFVRLIDDMSTGMGGMEEEGGG